MTVSVACCGRRRIATVPLPFEITIVRDSARDWLVLNKVAITGWVSVSANEHEGTCCKPAASRTWSVEGGDVNGTITSAGVYTAPKANGTYIIIATSVYDPRKKGTATVNVNSQVKVKITPFDNLKVNVGDSLQFSATVARAVGDNSVTWSVRDDPAGPAVGTIDPATGLYTAPAQRRIDTIRATSNFDPNQYAEVKVQVTAGGVGVIIN